LLPLIRRASSTLAFKHLHSATLNGSDSMNEWLRDARRIRICQCGLIRGGNQRRCRIRRTTGLPQRGYADSPEPVHGRPDPRSVEAVSSDDVLIGTLRLSPHLLEMVGRHGTSTPSARGGGTVVTLPRSTRETFLKCVQNYGVTRAYVVRPIVRHIRDPPAGDQIRPQLAETHWFRVRPRLPESLAESV